MNSSTKKKLEDLHGVIRQCEQCYLDERDPEKRLIEHPPNRATAFELLVISFGIFSVFLVAFFVVDLYRG